MATFKPLNRYTNGISTFTRNNVQFLMLARPLALELDNTDVYITLTADLIARPDLIAHKAYGNSTLWWAILQYNSIRDPIFELRSGQVLRIPTMDRVNTAIQQLGT